MDPSDNLMVQIPTKADAKDFLFEVSPQRTLDDLFLSQGVREMTDQLVEEHRQRELLESHRLQPRHKILLAGPSGNGKTAYAEALAERLQVPLFVVRYEGVVSSFLGDTSSNLQKLFDHVHDQRCVLFFDEFDVLGKERGDARETGEIKRVVSSLLLQIDRLPSHVVAISATNHPEMLDRAVWRRFDLRMELGGPTASQREEFVLRFFRKREIPPPGMKFLSELGDASFSDLEKFCLGVVRRYVLNSARSTLDQLVDSGLADWRNRYRQIEPDFVQIIR